MKGVRVKEFIAPMAIDMAINNWLMENPNINVVDIKYQVSDGRVRALVMYTKESSVRRCTDLEMISI